MRELAFDADGGALAVAWQHTDPTFGLMHRSTVAVYDLAEERWTARAAFDGVAGAMTCGDGRLAVAVAASLPVGRQPLFRDVALDDRTATTHTLHVLSFTAGQELRSVGLDLSAEEVDFLAALHPLMVTPWSAKRLVNLYRILRSSDGIDGPAVDYQAALVLLALVITFPEPAAALLARLVGSSVDGDGRDWMAFVQSCSYGPVGPDRPVWSAMVARLRQLPAGAPAEVGPYRSWAGRVSRFSFRAGHLLAARTAHPGPAAAAAGRCRVTIAAALAP